MPTLGIRHRSVIVIVAAAFAVLLAATVLASPPPAVAGNGSITYSFNANGRQGSGFYASPSGSGIVDPREFAYGGTCAENDPRVPPDDPEWDNLCIDPGTYCDNVPDSDRPRRIWYRYPGGDWVDTNEVICPTPGKPAFIPLAEALPDISEMVRRELHAPTARISPDPSGIVGVPVIEWAEGPAEDEPVVVHVHFPVEMTVVARPSYTWHFGDGTSAHGIGNAYDGTDPAAVPGYYQVSHAYDATGAYTITVDQSWEVRVSLVLDGLDIDAPVQSSSATVRIDELHNLLGD